MASALSDALSALCGEVRVASPTAGAELALDLSDVAAAKRLLQCSLVGLGGGEFWIVSDAPMQAEKVQVTAAGFPPAAGISADEFLRRAITIAPGVMTLGSRPTRQGAYLEGNGIEYQSSKFELCPAPAATGGATSIAARG